MTEINQEVELHDDDNEIVEANAHDPKNAEAQSVASVDKAGDATGSAPKRKGDNTKQDPMPKTKAALLTAMVGKMQGMSKESLMAMYQKEDLASVEGEEVVSETAIDLDYKADFSDDLNALVSEEATLSEDFKVKAEVIFEAAIKSKLAEEIDRLEEKYNEELAEEVESTKAELVEKVDSYLNYVVENWMEENKVAVETGLRTEIAESFMESLKSVFTEHYIDVPESKVDLVDDLSGQVEELEDQLNKSIEENMKLSESVETFTRDKVIAEASNGLASTEAERLKTLVEDIDFEDAESFAKKVETVKQSYFSKPVTESIDEVETAIDENGEEIEVSPLMSKYVTALSRTLK